MLTNPAAKQPQHGQELAPPLPMSGDAADDCVLAPAASDARARGSKTPEPLEKVQGVGGSVGCGWEGEEAGERQGGRGVGFNCGKVHDVIIEVTDDVMAMDSRTVLSPTKMGGSAGTPGSKTGAAWLDGGNFARVVGSGAQTAVGESSPDS